jgi:tetratricopeptide (TPR) repeat protein
MNARGPASLQAAQASQDLAVALRDAGDYRAADPLFREALRVRAQKFGPNHAKTDETRVHFSWLLIESGRYHEAATLLKTAIFNRSAVGDIEAQAFAEATYAAALLERGKTNEAKDHFLYAFALYGSLEGYSKMVVRFVENFQSGSIATLEGKWQEAVNLLRTCNEETRMAIGDEHPYTVWARGQYAWALWNHGDSQRAMEESLATLKLAEVASLADHPKIARLHWLIAQIHFDRREFKECRHHILESRKINELRFGKESVQYASDLIGLARLANEQEGWTDAEEHARRAIGILAQVKKSDPPFAAQDEVRRNVGEANLELGRCLYGQGRSHDALQGFEEAFQQAEVLYRSDYRKTLHGLESLHESLGGRDEARSYRRMLENVSNEWVVPKVTGDIP